MRINECKQADDLYSFVTKNPAWKTTRWERRRWVEHGKSVKSANNKKPKKEEMH